MLSATIAKVVWLVGIVVWVAIRYPFQRRAKRLGVATSARDTRERVILGIATCGQFILPIAYVVVSLALGRPMFGDYAFQPLVGWLGIVALVAGLAMFRATHKQLGRNWSVTLETRTSHQLVVEGLYGWVRHPMYSSFLLTAIAQLLLLPNWIVGPAGLVAFAILFFSRVDREEMMMIETFGDRYRGYMAQTARIVPWVY